MEKGFIYSLYDHYNRILRIGKTKHENKKRQLVQMGYYPSTLICFTYECYDYHNVEKYLHKLLAHKRKKGDWFYMECHDLLAIMHDDPNCKCISATCPTLMQILKLMCQNEHDNDGIRRYGFDNNNKKEFSRNNSSRTSNRSKLKAMKN